MGSNTNEVKKFFPSDWPKDGEIDLAVHDLPHHSSTTEWWYMHSHIQGTKNREYSLFASFFRKVIDFDKKNKLPIYGYSMIWAITDVSEKEYHTVSLVDKRAPKLGLQRLKRGEIVKDPFIKRAAIEMLKRGAFPKPDELLINDVIIPNDKLHLDYDGNTFKKNKDNSYSLHVFHKEKNIGAELRFDPKKPPIRHGDNGVVRGVTAEDMFYYFIPHCEVTGNLTVKGEKIKIESAKGWYDHEFGAHPDNQDKKKQKDVSWNWIAMQLDNGCELTAYDLIETKSKKTCGAFVILIDEKGKRHYSDNFVLKPTGEKWVSTRTFNYYPTAWTLESKELGLKVTAVASLENQEFPTAISKPAFWEGRMVIKGSLKGKKISGNGYIERHGFVYNDDLNDFLQSVSKTTLDSVKKIMPLSFGKEKFEELVSKEGNSNFIQGLDKKAYINTLIRPVRDITDRRGKSWRSYATVACCDVVGGDSQKAIDWLALPELLHVGSLIVDDVEDQSDVRRGGPACHKIYGEATAINAGSAAYFLGQICIYRAKDEESKKVRIYNWYFESMRASHTGQAMDIYGLDYMMPKALKDDETARLLSKRVLATHRLKSAAPASYLAKIGALIGGGTEEQIEGLGNFYEALGIAFQIIDDTLNLKGFKDNLKTKGEDITAGKITYPVAKAMPLLNKKDRKRLWEIVSAKTEDITLLKEAVSLLDKHNAIELCEKEAKNIVERAWKKLDPLVTDSMVKINLRAFSLFVLERTY